MATLGCKKRTEKRRGKGCLRLAIIFWREGEMRREEKKNRRVGYRHTGEKEDKKEKNRSER